MSEADFDLSEAEIASLTELATVVDDSLPKVAIMGRPNVGKSTLVNRIIGHRRAVVQDKPGVTRDIIKYPAVWEDNRFVVLDTGGWSDKGWGFGEDISKRAETAINLADIIFLVVDTRVGITDEEENLVKKLRKLSKPVFLVANKVDNETLLAEVANFWKLGLGNPFPVSAVHGTGVADLLDQAIKKFPQVKAASSSGLDYPRRVALVGKPNVGKSSLLNKLSGKVVSLVHDESGTTVDPVDSLLTLDQVQWNFVDTAGLRKKVSNSKGFEYYASLRTAAAIDSAEVAVVLIDATENITEQDQRIISMVIEAGRALVIAFNKWDLVNEYRQEVLKKEIALELQRVTWAKYLNISATTGRSIHRLEKYLLEALVSWDKRIGTGRLNNWLRGVVASNPPPANGGKIPKILFATQATNRPPTFVFFTTGFLAAGYRRFLERRLREEFNFDGSPIKILVRIKEKRKFVR